MDILKFLVYAGPLAALCGGAYAVVREVFKYGWRLAQVEVQAKDTAEAVVGLEVMKESVITVKVMVEELVREKRQHERGHRND